MVASGPIPNRSEDLSRERDANRSNKDPLRKGELKPVEFYAPDPEWHSSCQRMWNSIPESGMAPFFQVSDLAMLWSLLEDLSNAKKNTRNGVPPAILLTAIYNQLNNFGFTEGDRRRMRIELEAPVEDTASVEEASVAFYQEALASVTKLPPRGNTREGRSQRTG